MGLNDPTALEMRLRVEESTQWLRAADDPVAARLRALLRERGFDPERLVLADCFPDDSAFWFGLLVTPDRRCIQFGFDHLHQALAEGTFSEWKDMTDS